MRLNKKLSMLLKYMFLIKKVYKDICNVLKYWLFIDFVRKVINVKRILVMMRIIIKKNNNFWEKKFKINIIIDYKMLCRMNMLNNVCEL